MKTSILRNSQQHIDAVRAIDDIYNTKRDRKEDSFKAEHPDMSYEDTEEWLSFLADNESRRLCEFETLKKRIVDPPPPIRPEPLPEAEEPQPELPAEAEPKADNDDATIDVTGPLQAQVTATFDMPADPGNLLHVLDPAT